MRKAFTLVVLAFCLTSCEELHHLAKQYPDVVDQTTAPTNNEIIAGLKDALRVGITNAVVKTDQVMLLRKPLSFSYTAGSDQNLHTVSCYTKLLS